MKLRAVALAAVTGALFTATVAAAAVIVGTPGDDVLRGTEQADRISAFAGNDAVYARGGADDIRAGAGNDGIRAADGSDLAYGGRGDDVVAGGDGNDRLYGGSDADQVLGGNGDDRAAGNKGSDVVQGGDGDDSLFGGLGAGSRVRRERERRAARAGSRRRPRPPELRPGRRQGVGPPLRATPDADRRLRDDLRRGHRFAGSGRGRERGRRHRGGLLNHQAIHQPVTR